MKYVTSIFNTALLVRQFGNRFSTNQRMFSSLTNNEINPIQNIYNQLDLIPDISYSVNNPVLCPHLKSVLDTMKTVTLTDLGLTETQVLAMTRNTCSTIIEVTDRFEIAVFHMSAGCTLPIHDHPYMAVLSNVVYGEIKLQSFSPNPIDMPTGKGFASDSRQSSTKSQSIIARCCNEGTKTPQDGAWLLSPQDGNYHEFTASSNSIVLDILLPPYNESRGRVCNYYSINSHPDGTRVVLTQRTDDPFKDRRDVPLLVPYTGIQPRRRIFPRFKATY